MTLKRLTVGAPPRAKAAGKSGATRVGADSGWARQLAILQPHPTLLPAAGAARLSLSLVGLVDGLSRGGVAALGLMAPNLGGSACGRQTVTPATNTKQTLPSWGSWCPWGRGWQGVGPVSAPRRGGGWRRQLAGGAGGSWALGRKGPLRAGLHPLFPSPALLLDPPLFWGALETPRCAACLAQEFENAEGEEYAADFSAQGSPSQRRLRTA